MNTQQYISSGILEQYAFGLLSAEEAKEVEVNLEQYPELVAELRQIEYAIEAYVAVYKEKLTPEFYSQLKENLKGIEPDPIITSTSSGGSTFPKLLGALALVALLVSLGWLFRNFQQLEADKERIELELASLQDNCDQLKIEKTTLETLLRTIRQSGNVLTQMKGTDNAPEALASVIWNAETKEAHLDVINMPPPPTDKQYQLWAIVDGVPVDMGVFDVVVDATGLQDIPFIESPQAFAVTLEPRGGSVEPTLEEMVVVGNFVVG